MHNYNDCITTASLTAYSICTMNECIVSIYLLFNEGTHLLHNFQDKKNLKRRAVCALNMLERAKKEEQITTKDVKYNIQIDDVQASLLHNLISNLELHGYRMKKAC